MYVYWGLLSILCFNAFLIMTKEFKKLGPFLLFNCCIILVFFAGFRNGVGYDYFSYLRIYEQVSDLTEIFKGNINYNELHGEYGYLFLNSLVKSIGLGFHGVLFAVAFISIGLLTHSFKKFTPYYLVALCIYVSRFYFVRDMGQIRQGIACALILFSLTYVAKRQFKKFLFIIILASLFHSVALLAIPMYLIFNLEIKNKVKVLTLFASIILGSFDWLRELINSLSTVLPESIIGYTNSQTEGYALGILNPVAIMQMIILLFFMKYKDIISKKIKYYHVLLNAYWVSTVLLFLLNDVAIIAGRISTVFATVEPIIVSSIIFIFKNKLLGYCLILVYIVLMFYSNFVLKLDDLYAPYNNILF